MAPGTAERDARGRGRHAARLERMVAEAAATLSRAAWFPRDPTGGTCIPQGPSRIHSCRRLPSHAFPVLSLPEHRPDADAAALVGEYLRRIAP